LSFPSSIIIDLHLKGRRVGKGYLDALAETSAERPMPGN
jgi:hypothetical protein